MLRPRRPRRCRGCPPGTRRPAPPARSTASAAVSGAPVGRAAAHRRAARSGAAPSPSGAGEHLLLDQEHRAAPEVVRTAAARRRARCGWPPRTTGAARPGSAPGGARAPGRTAGTTRCRSSGPRSCSHGHAPGGRSPAAASRHDQSRVPPPAAAARPARRRRSARRCRGRARPAAACSGEVLRVESSRSRRRTSASTVPRSRAPAGLAVLRAPARGPDLLGRGEVDLERRVRGPPRCRCRGPRRRSRRSPRSPRRSARAAGRPARRAPPGMRRHRADRAGHLRRRGSRLRRPRPPSRIAGAFGSVTESQRRPPRPRRPARPRGSAPSSPARSTARVTRPVHRAGVEVRGAARGGQPSRHGGLPGAGRSVHRHDPVQPRSPAIPLVLGPPPLNTAARSAARRPRAADHHALWPAVGFARSGSYWGRSVRRAAAPRR